MCVISHDSRDDMGWLRILGIVVTLMVSRSWPLGGDNFGIHHHFHCQIPRFGSWLPFPLLNGLWDAANLWNMYSICGDISVVKFRWSDSTLIHHNLYLYSFRIHAAVNANPAPPPLPVRHSTPHQFLPHSLNVKDIRVQDSTHPGQPAAVRRSVNLRTYDAAYC
jgi:hypothetical protein